MRSDARRNHEVVLETAIRLLGERPTASMQEVADASGVGRTTVYRHFPNRDDLVRALAQQVAQEAKALSDAVAADEDPVPEVLRRLARQVITLGTRYRFLQSQPGADETIRSEMEASDRVFEHWFARGQRRGELRDDMPASWMLSTLRGLGIVAVHETDDLQREEAARLLGETLVAAFSPR